MNSLGQVFKVTLFGESHGSGVGIVIDNCPPGTPVSKSLIQAALDRRRPGQSAITTQRRESDRCQILSGIFRGRASGGPIALWIENCDVDSSLYEKFEAVPRPGHADFTARAKYKGFHDYRGGGMFSGRLTAPLVASGAIAGEILEQEGIDIVAHTVQVGQVRLESTLSFEAIQQVRDENPVRCGDAEIAEQMIEEITEARKRRDSVGGVVEVRARGLPVGLGEPFFATVEGELARAVFAIPAVKGIEFGAGFAAANMRGSEHNDPFLVQGDRVVCETNHAGGILGGLTTGMPLVYRVAVKPPSSIPLPQRSVNIETLKAETIVVKGRHDPCITPRAVPVFEAVTALVLADFLLQARRMRDYLGEGEP